MSIFDSTHRCIFRHFQKGKRSKYISEELIEALDSTDNNSPIVSRVTIYKDLVGQIDQAIQDAFSKFDRLNFDAVTHFCKHSVCSGHLTLKSTPLEFLSQLHSYVLPSAIVGYCMRSFTYDNTHT